MKPAGRYLIAAVAAAALAGCGPRVAPAAEPAPASEAEKAGYLPGPQLTRVETTRSGGVLVRGAARPGGRVRVTAANGEAYGATADDQGRFALEIPAQGGPLFAKLATVEGQRATLAEGVLFVPPADPRRAALLRAGAPSTVIDAAAPLIAAFDYDAGGGAAVSGLAAPGIEVRVSLDGAAVGSVRADRQGRWTFRLSRAPAGAHVLRAAAGERSQERRILVVAGSAGEGASVVREADAWRIDWAVPGGGAQSTLLFTEGAAS